MKRLVLPVVLPCAALAVVASVALPQVASFSHGDAPVPVYEVERGAFTRTVMADGFLEAETTTPITAPTEARNPHTIAWLAPDGKRVQAGDVVIRFDPSEAERNLLDGRAERSAAEQRMERQTVQSAANAANLERLAGMAGLELDYASKFQSKDAEIFSRSAIIESEIDQDLAKKRRDHAQGTRDVSQQLSRVELELLGLEKKKAELKIEEAESGLRSLDVRAPHDGIFVIKRDFRGETQVGQSVWPGQPLAEIPLLDVMRAKVYVLEADAGGLAEGVEGEVVLDAYPTAPYKARVERVAALAQRLNRRSPVQYFEVQLALERTESERMKPGQRVSAALFMAALDDVIAVPRQAIVEQDDGDKVVFRRGARGFEPVEVKLGQAALGRVVIESGLEPGDVIALTDPTQVPEKREDRANAERAAPRPGAAP
jgi:RND family efflux transporter MFP subunit